MTTGQRGRRRAPRVVVVGGGAAGTLVATHLVRSATLRGTALEVDVLEPADRLGRGTAYGTTDDAHLLNVPASGMSALPENPGHFVAWRRRAAPHPAGGSDGVRSSAGARALPRGHPRGLVRSGPGRRRRPAGACPRPRDPSYGGGAGAHHERRERTWPPRRSWSRPASPPRVTTGPRRRCGTRRSSCPTHGRPARSDPSSATAWGTPTWSSSAPASRWSTSRCRSAGKAADRTGACTACPATGGCRAATRTSVRLAAIPDVSEWGDTLDGAPGRGSPSTSTGSGALGRLAGRRGRAPLPGRRAVGPALRGGPARRSSPRTPGRGTCCVTGCPRAAPAGSTSCARPGGWRSWPARSWRPSRWPGGGVALAAGRRSALRGRLGGQLHRPAARRPHAWATRSSTTCSATGPTVRWRPSRPPAWVSARSTVVWSTVSAAPTRRCGPWARCAAASCGSPPRSPRSVARHWLWRRRSSTRSRRSPAGSPTAGWSAGTTRWPGRATRWGCRSRRPPRPRAPYNAGLERLMRLQNGGEELVEEATRLDPDFAVGARHARDARPRGRGRHRRTRVPRRRGPRAGDQGRRARAQSRRRRPPTRAATPADAAPARSSTTSPVTPATSSRCRRRCRRSRSPASPTSGRRHGTSSRGWPRRTATTGGTSRCSRSCARTRRGTTTRCCSPRSALSCEPSSGHAVHALTHALYETGDHEHGRVWLDHWVEQSGRSASHRAHFSWHAALHELALGDTEAVRRRYYAQLAPPTVTGVRALVDSASLLWRWRITLGGLGRRRRRGSSGPASLRVPRRGGLPPVAPVLDTVDPALLDRPLTPFVALHAALALAATGDVDRLRRLERYCRAGSGKTVRAVVVPVCDALVVGPGVALGRGLRTRSRACCRTSPGSADRRPSARSSRRPCSTAWCGRVGWTPLVPSSRSGSTAGRHRWTSAGRTRSHPHARVFW